MASAYPALPSVASLIARDDDRSAVVHAQVKSVNSAACCDLMRSLQLEILILGGIGIVKDAVLDCARHGAVNCHPGLLPWIQGSLPVAQSLVRGIPIASSCHRVSSDLDKGPLIDISYVDRARSGDRFEDIILAVCRLAARQAHSVLCSLALTDKVPSCAPLSLDEGECFTWDDDIEAAAKRVLLEEDAKIVLPRPGRRG